MPTAACRSTLLLLLVAGCQVQQRTPLGDTGATDLPSLRRASVALQDRIHQERNHVDDFNRQLRELYVEEDRLYAEIQDREMTVQQLQDDLEGVLGDVDAATDELRESEAYRDARLIELETLRTALATHEQERATLRAANERLLGELEAERRRLVQLQADRKALDALTRAPWQPDWITAGGLSAATAPPGATALPGTVGLTGPVGLPGQWSLGPIVWVQVLEQVERGRRAAADQPPRDG